MIRQCHHGAPTVEGTLTTMTAMSLGDTNLWDNLLMCSPVLTKTLWHMIESDFPYNQCPCL